MEAAMVIAEAIVFASPLPQPLSFRATVAPLAPRYTKFGIPATLGR